MIQSVLVIVYLALSGDAGIDSLDVRLEQTRIYLEELEGRQASSEEILLGIHAHLGAARGYYNELAVREARITMDIHSIDQRWFLTDSARAELEAGVEEYILFLYSHRRLVGPSVLFAPGGISRYLRRMSFMDHLAESAIEQMQHLEQSGDSLSSYRDSLEVLVEDVRVLRLQMQEAQERIYREEERQTLLRQSLESEIAAARDSAEAMEQRRQQLSAFVTTLRATVSTASIPSADISSTAYFAVNRGNIGWPVRGTVVRGFGLDRDPVYGTETVSDGIAIAVAGNSARVSTIGPGIILYAREYLTMGRMVILDHLDGYYTVYAHLGSLEVSRGETVDQGSFLGMTGPLPGGRSGCYLEIRRAGQPVNPLEYLE
ncbi:MAG: peptidoglycan DD-metalloendopeptidase family protein [Candidatus Sabulitectum sp.]|nr:peptidoglycan DD-metalloendopeptidase family protein [Candidatus Sabulitectum sp.]